MKYNESNIDKKVLKGLEEMGFVDMTPIQEMAIPVLMKGEDIIGQAQTGTGKTAAFGIPMIQQIDPKVETVQGLILCPTRELAIQAAEELRKMAKYTHGVKVVPIYGGQDIERQIRQLKGKVSIVVGTPGRVMDHMRRRTLKLENLRMLVLDEADEMLNMGFREDIETICETLPEERQTALFSATMPKEILEITEEYQHDAQLLKVKQQELTIPLVKQFYYIIKPKEKDESLCRLIDYMSPKKALIFCNTKKKVDQLTLMLKGKGYYAEALHGDLSQHQRDRVMDLFRNGTLSLLLATDVAARGIDVDDVEAVFNYDMPQDMEYYVHRIGRTGRAGKKGKAFSLITSREKYKIKSLVDYCKTEIVQKELPSAATANTAKAYRNLDEAINYCEDVDLTEYMKIVYKRCVDDGTDAIAIAAAFLRMSMGELSESSDSEKQKRNRSNGKNRSGKERNSKERSGKERSGKERSGKEQNGKETNRKDSKKEVRNKSNGKRSNSSSKNKRYDDRRSRSRKK